MGRYSTELRGVFGLAFGTSRVVSSVAYRLAPSADSIPHCGLSASRSIILSGFGSPPPVSVFAFQRYNRFSVFTFRPAGARMNSPPSGDRPTSPWESGRSNAVSGFGFSAPIWSRGYTSTRLSVNRTKWSPSGNQKAEFTCTFRVSVPSSLARGFGFSSFAGTGAANRTGATRSSARRGRMGASRGEGEATRRMAHHLDGTLLCDRLAPESRIISSAEPDPTRR